MGPTKRRSRKSEMSHIDKAMHQLDMGSEAHDHRAAVSFAEFVRLLAENPEPLMRNIFQVFHDLVTSHVVQGVDEYPDDPESIQYLPYDCSRLFVEGLDHPFFADRIFANRLMNLVEAFKRGAQQNKIYIFNGPPGCGKSTFLNNLLLRLEQYANTPPGRRYEVVWRLDRRLLGALPEAEGNAGLEKLCRLLSRLDAQHAEAGGDGGEGDGGQDRGRPSQLDDLPSVEPYVEVTCPSHDNPILLIPKPLRRRFFDALFENNEFKWNLSTGKEYDWVFHDEPCTICSSLFEALMTKLQDSDQVFRMIYARPYHLDRRLGEGITVFNPGDRPRQKTVLTNPMLQNQLNRVFMDSNQVRYIHSPYARTNNGIYALMDIKSHNKERLIELHNVISEGLFKVEDIEENVNSLFLAVMNPEDEKNVQGFQSFSDRIEHIIIPYVLDLKTEVEIYKNVFGGHILECFLPRVLHNFARVVVSTRLSSKSEALLEWIDDPDKYSLYCDENLQILKMEIYTGHIPAWLSESDQKGLTARRRRAIIAESEKEGAQGFSGRDSIKLFNDFFSAYCSESKLIDMTMLSKYFINLPREQKRMIPSGFLDSLQRHYNYQLLQEIKEALYDYNEDQISRDIQNYIFAVNFEIGTSERCSYTGDRLEITEDFLRGIEVRLLDPDPSDDERREFRRDTQKEYTSKTLTQEIMNEGLSLTETDLFRNLHDRYVYSLKEKVLDPFLENENFRRAIKDFGTDDFKTYDRRIRDDVGFMMRNLVDRFRYTEQGAQEVCIYAIDHDLARKFGGD